MPKYQFKIGDAKVELPIIQGGMGVGYSLHKLASAVAREGGIGIIATAGVGFAEPDFATHYPDANNRALRQEIRKARELARGGLLGTNIMVALTNYDDMVSAAIEEGIDFIFSGAGLPLHLPALLHKVPNAKTKLVPIVSSGRALELITKTWVKNYNYFPDATVVEGPKAGGHLGYKYEELTGTPPKLKDIFLDVKASAEKIRQQFKKTIPVIAAGGIFTGKDIKEYLDLGAVAAQIGTRFVATEEADVSQAVKELYVRTKKEDVIIIKSPVGMPGRAIRNEFLNAVGRGEKKPFRCPYHCIKTCNPTQSPYCIAFALINANLGKLEEGFAFCGSNVYRVKEISTVPKLIHELISGL
ncbi:MAG: nitronate monooxygenase [Candidatus Wallbacteria bacterium]|nr:nitronate monooxygenase [Candidatus Wallbacteria bacterium]